MITATDAANQQLRSKSAAAIMKVCVIQLNLNDAECYIFIFYFCSFFTPTSTLLKIYV